MTTLVERVPITGIKRTSITGIKRTPILGEETPTEELNWDDLYGALVNYIKFASKQVAGQFSSNTLFTAEDYFQEGQLLLYHCYMLYKHKPMNEFCALFKASLWRKLREIGGKKGFIQVDIEDAYDMGYTEDVVENMYSEYKLKQVAEMLKESPIALTIFKEFINPSSRTLWEAEMDMARKSMLKSQNYKISVPKTVQIRGVFIQRALEIPKTEFNEHFKFVKKCVCCIYHPQESEASDEQVEELLNNDTSGLLA